MICLFVKYGYRERKGDTERQKYSLCCLLRKHSRPGLARVEARSQELQPGLPHGWEEPGLLAISCCVFEHLGMEMENS